MHNITVQMDLSLLKKMWIFYQKMVEKPHLNGYFYLVLKVTGRLHPAQVAR